MSKELEELIQSGRKSMEGASSEARARVTERVASSTGAMLAVAGAAATAEASAAGGSVVTGFAMTGAVKVAAAGVLAICAVGTGYVVMSPSGSTETAVIDSRASREEASQPESIEAPLALVVDEPVVEEEEPVEPPTAAPISNGHRSAVRREVEPTASHVDLELPSLRDALSALRAASDALSRHDASEAIAILSASEIPASLVEQREGLLAVARCRLSPERRSALRTAFEVAHPRSPMGPRVRAECSTGTNDRDHVDSITE